MKKTKSNFMKRTAFLLGLVAACGSAHAGFQYTNQDVIIGFRGGSFELVVDAGSVSNLLSVPLGNTIVITSVTAGQLAAAGGANGIKWSASACIQSEGNPSYPLQTLWVSRPRLNYDNQTAPWKRFSDLSQGSTSSHIDGIGDSAHQYGLGVPTDANNTASGIVIPAATTAPYEKNIGNGNFALAFQGNVEASTSGTFTTDGQAVRSDFYQIIPDDGNGVLPGTYLGYFTFNTNGVMTYTAGPSPLAPPIITSVTRSGTDTTVSFTTQSAVQYSLSFTNSTGLSSPVATWPNTGNVTGNGSIKSLTHTASDANLFYKVKATQ